MLDNDFFFLRIALGFNDYLSTYSYSFFLVYQL